MRCPSRDQICDGLADRGTELEAVLRKAKGMDEPRRGAALVDVAALANQTFHAAIGALVIWVFYSSQVLLVGAEFTEVYARLFGSKIVPDDKAVPLPRVEAKQRLLNRARDRCSDARFDLRVGASLNRR